MTVSFVPRDAFVLKIQRELCHPKYARKVSGLSRNRPQGRKLRVQSSINFVGEVRRFQSTFFNTKKIVANLFCSHAVPVAKKCVHGKSWDADE